MVYYYYRFTTDIPKMQIPILIPLSIRVLFYSSSSKKFYDVDDGGNAQQTKT